MAFYTDTFYVARKTFGGIYAGDAFELVVTDNNEFYIEGDDGSAWLVVPDPYDDVLFLANRNDVKFDKVAS